MRLFKNIGPNLQLSVPYSQLINQESLDFIFQTMVPYDSFAKSNQVPDYTVIWA